MCKCGHAYSDHTFTRLGWNETRRTCDKCECRFYIRAEVARAGLVEVMVLGTGRSQPVEEHREL